MTKFESLADKHPMAFALVVTIVFILLVLISSILANLAYPAGTPGWYVVSLAGRLVSILILLILLSRLDWLRSAGFTSLGSRQTWLLALPALVYSIVVSAFAMTGNFNFSFSDPVLAVSASLFLMAHAFLEETAFRGLVMHDFVRAWGGTSRGLVKSVIISSLYYGGYHLLYLAGEPLAVVLGRIVVTSLMGVLFGALVLRGNSIYPAAFFHGAWNIAGFLNLPRNSMDGTPRSWMVLSLFTLPLALYGLFLLRGFTRYYSHTGRSPRMESPGYEHDPAKNERYGL